MPLEIAEQDIGGARVRMGFNTFLPDGTNRRFKAGEHLTADAVRAMRLANRRALTSAGFIEVYPARTEVKHTYAEQKAGDRYIVQVSKNQFNVIEGYKLNDKPLSRDDADALAAAK